MTFMVAMPTSVFVIGDDVTDQNQYYINYDIDDNVTDYYMPNNDFLKQTRAGTHTTTTYKLIANQDKYSKVKVYTSYTWKKYKANVYDNYTGEFQYSYNFVTTNQTHEKLQVVYQ